ncbi:hypothetical protein J1N35_009836 [Gossypium stocksii]|uniref:Uncharacterized protein n=1 Tax=Gossypium stocksii TaxID=47602 RepID=A0A9D3W1A4_9ROSI|nr:hypothetical protein J1N35_009836 [Gossypium stocksii]
MAFPRLTLIVLLFPESVSASTKSLQFHTSLDFQALYTKAKCLLYTLADAVVTAAGSSDTTVQKNGGWAGFISDLMEWVLKIATFPLTKQQL